MGKQVLPSISKLEDVLDLLTDPDKYIKYLKEFRDVHDLTMQTLGILDTKEKAEEYLAAAKVKEQEAKIFATNEKAKLSKHALELDQEAAVLKQSKAEFAERVRAFEQSAQQTERALLNDRANFESYKVDAEKVISTQSAQNGQVRHDLERLSDELAERRSKIAAAAAALQ